MILRALLQLALARVFRRRSPSDHNLSAEISASGRITVRLEGRIAPSTQAWVKIGRRILALNSARTASLQERHGVRLVIAWLRPVGHRAKPVAFLLLPGLKKHTHPTLISPQTTSPPATQRRVQLTVIVPNYNHANYLEQRLASIREQTCPPDEIILLDDASTDGSTALLDAFAKRDPVPGRTRIIHNSKNSGSPFAQWARGLREATGDLVWIAESDDWCAPDFLQRIIPAFNDPAVLLAHGYTNFVGETGNPLSQSLEKIHKSVGSRAVQRSGMIASQKFVNEGMAVRNLIPNASAVVFRRPGPKFPIFNDPEWASLRVCGDWIFYLYRLRGGKIAFVREAQNYYRVHATNTSLQTHREERYHREHSLVALHLAGTYRISEDAIYRQLAWLEAYHAKHHPSQENGSPRLPTTLYAAANLPAAAARRKPNVLVAIHAFVAGGAEGFALRLALALRRLGCAVTLLELGAHPQDAAVRTLVPADMPVITVNEHRHCAIARILSDHGIEWVSTHHPRCDLALARASDLLRASERPRLFCTHHGFYHLDAANLFREQTLFTRTVDLWINVAERGRLPFEVAGLLTSATTPHFTQLPAAVVIPAKQPAPPIHPGAAAPFIITVASRALPEKGWREAIAAVAASRSKTGRNLRLVLAGSGPVYDELRTEGTPDFVELIGFHSDVPALYAQSHLGLLATTYAGESCPLGVVECLAAGRPVVVTEIGETRVMLEATGGTLAGALVASEPASTYVDRLAAALSILSTDSEAYAEAAARASERARAYDINVVAASYLAHYQSHKVA